MRRGEKYARAIEVGPPSVAPLPQSALPSTRVHRTATAGRKQGETHGGKGLGQKAGLEPLCELADASREELHAAKKELIDVKPSCTQDALALLRLACENLETFNELEAWETDVLRRANSYLQRVAA
jgi:hypothetical protein